MMLLVCRFCKKGIASAHLHLLTLRPLRMALRGNSSTICYHTRAPCRERVQYLSIFLTWRYGKKLMIRYRSGQKGILHLRYAQIWRMKMLGSLTHKAACVGVSTILADAYVFHHLVLHRTLLSFEIERL